MISSTIFAKIVKQIKMLGLLLMALGFFSFAESVFAQNPALVWVQCNAACDVGDCTAAVVQNCAAFTMQCRGDKPPGGAWPPGCANCKCTNAQLILWCLCSEQVSEQPPL